MNISLPINIFDKRTLLELWIGQNGYASVLLESGGIINNPIEQLKYTACFALTKFYLSGAQLKPFNPLLGETFQGQFGAAGRSIVDATVDTVKAPIDLTRTALSGSMGLLQTTGDEVAYMVDAKGYKISAINPKEHVTIAFGCSE